MDSTNIIDTSLISLLLINDGEEQNFILILMYAVNILSIHKTVRVPNTMTNYYQKFSDARLKHKLTTDREAGYKTSLYTSLFQGNFVLKKKVQKLIDSILFMQKYKYLSTNCHLIKLLLQPIVISNIETYIYLLQVKQYVSYIVCMVNILKGLPLEK